MNQEDLIQSKIDDSDQQPESAESAEQESKNYRQEWLEFYKEEKVKFDDVEEKLNRADRYDNLPTAINNNGTPPGVKHLFELEQQEIPEELKQGIERMRQIERFIKQQMQIVGLKSENGKRFWDLVNQTTLSKEEYRELVGFVDKMEQIIQEGIKQGFKSTDLTQ